MTSEELWVSRVLHKLNIGFIVDFNDGFFFLEP